MISVVIRLLASVVMCLVAPLAYANAGSIGVISATLAITAINSSLFLDFKRLMDKQ
ncbi:hypothetical protein VPHK567_0279 [Vibrio phage K567]